jgi:AcrR family transcriptional regulator
VIPYGGGDIRRDLRFSGREPPTPGTAHQRAAALTSRAAILQAAHDALTDASLNSIAKRVAVGSGTLYQHFPTRGDLPPAVYWHDMTRLVDSVPEILPAYLSCRRGSERIDFVPL